MANITKNQVKARLKKILDILGEQWNELQSLKDEVEDESYNIEPYEGKDELTPQQEERQEWLEEATSTLEDQCYSLEEIINNLETIE